MESSLVGILLVGQTNSSEGSHIGLVNIPSGSRDQSVSEFRPLLMGTLSKLMDLEFVFVTPNGWEVSSTMETTAKLSDVISSEGVMKVRVAYTKPKFGISIEGLSHDHTAAGFIFCDSDLSVAQARVELKFQLPSLYQFLSTVHFAFLDLDGWPIGSQQESEVTLLEVASQNVVRIRCARPLSSPSTPDPVTMERRQASIEQSIDSRILQPGSEMIQGMPDMQSLHKGSTSHEFEILLSYVHSEASSYAIMLKKALEERGFTVFLDVHCIQGGVDWQDVLNDAISNCALFVPLITPQYGQTLWTNREVKLADVLGKIIIPVNFLSNWPPKCLAIQFATTQFVEGITKKHAAVTVSIDNVVFEMICEVATDISSRYTLEKASNELEQAETQSTASSLGDTQPISEDAVSVSGSNSSVYLSPPAMSRKKSIRSYASALPSTVNESYRDSITSSRSGKPLIVVCCASEQKQFAEGLRGNLKTKSYEVWCATDIEPEETEENSRLIFQQKADEAGVVIFVLSEEFATSSFCEQQVYYCEQRKRIIPVIYKPIKLPNWMAMLVGTNQFITCQASDYLTSLFDRVESLFNPEKNEVELKNILKDKLELANMCSKLSDELPKGKLVYISGGTQFYSKKGEAICKALGKELALDDDVVVVTGGFFGVGDCVSKSFFDQRVQMLKPHGVCHVVAIKDKQDKSSQTRQNPDGTFLPVPFGDTLFFGNCVREREKLTPRVVDLCILIEGGPGAAFEAQEFAWNGNQVIPVKSTGGAAGGLFNIPSSIFTRPPNVAATDWDLLSNAEAPPEIVARALYRIVQVIKTPAVVKERERCSSTSDTKIIKRKRVSIKRSDTLPGKDSYSSLMYRTISDK